MIRTTKISFGSHRYLKAFLLWKRAPEQISTALSIFEAAKVAQPSGHLKEEDFIKIGLEFARIANVSRDSGLKHAYEFNLACVKMIADIPNRFDAFKASGSTQSAYTPPAKTIGLNHH